MLRWALLVSLLLPMSLFAEVGKITKIIGTNDSYILRQNEKVSVSLESLIEEGDEIFSENCVVLIHLYPSSQISLAKNTHIRITQNLIEEAGEKEKTFSIIDYVKGIVRLQVTKDKDQEIEQKIQANGVAFAVRGTEFEVSQDGEDFELDVVEGEVEVSSPFVQTFVPEIVKANEGFSFNKKARKFKRRKFRMKFKNHPGFASRAEMREKWKQKKLERRLNRQEKRAGKNIKKRDRKNARKKNK